MTQRNYPKWIWLTRAPRDAAWPEPTPLAQEPGAHSVLLSVAPVDPGDLARPDRLERLWKHVYLPPHAAFLRDFVAIGDGTG